ncbi:hypothetical protein [Novosphingobium sp. MBES04]|uniref:hypothetical protein n=1 Tax=Novosphingobium sp. MBES04 TaxID=1206458 RepID=UPI001185D945|nr:hypothetical protein [Novosphingobium sp. MBES04]
MHGAVRLAIGLGLLTCGLTPSAQGQSTTQRATTATPGDSQELARRVTAAAYPLEVRNREMDRIVDTVLDAIRASYAFADEAPPFARDMIEEHLARFSVEMRRFAYDKIALRMTQGLERAFARKFNRLSLIVLDAQSATPDGREDLQDIAREIYTTDPDFLETENAIVRTFIAAERHKSRQLRQNIRDIQAGRIFSP